MSYHLAIDIGASSGRHIIGEINNELSLKEIHRFSISVNEIDGYLRLNLNKLLKDIDDGLKKAAELEIEISTIGIDTWGVDFVALDSNDLVISSPMFYRDKIFSNELNRYTKENDLYELYKKTGIQIQGFNTYFQLNCLNESYKNLEVDNILLLPDYLNFYLTKVKGLEFTNATTTQCLLKNSLDINHSHGHLFNKMIKNRKLGSLYSQKYGFINNPQVISVASHDTASAHVSVPSVDNDVLFISSGTWSLIGTNVDTPVTSKLAFEYNYSNEGSYDGTYRLQKNIMGLWIIQNIKKEYEKYSFEQIANAAYKSNITSVIDCNDVRFLNPNNMCEEIKNFCIQTEQQIPKTINDFAKIAYKSLAIAYCQAIDEIESITGISYESIYIVGGGANANLLNEYTKRISNKKVFVFKNEASSIGNILVQAIENGNIKNLKQARLLVANSFEIEEIK